MNTILLDGKALRAKKYVEFKKRIALLKDKGIYPHLAVILVGENPASQIYVGNKQKACEELGIKSTLIHLPNTIAFEKLKSEVEKLNSDPWVHGILVQFPLPKSLRGNDIISCISPNKDADGLHPFNQGVNLTSTNTYAPLPCTAQGVMELLKEYHIDVVGKDALVIGRSNIVGKPVSYLLGNANATVSLSHSKTSRETLKMLASHADIIVLATGVPDLIAPEMIKPGAVIIDVGIIRQENNKIRGDVLYKNFLGKASYISPVPGGVGPMTVTMLMENVIRLAETNLKG